MAWAVTQSLGVWRRAGMGGALSGVDWQAAMVRAEAIAREFPGVDFGVNGAGEDRGELVAMIGQIEAGAIAGEAQVRRRQADTD